MATDFKIPQALTENSLLMFKTMREHEASFAAMRAEQRARDGVAVEATVPSETAESNETAGSNETAEPEEPASSDEPSDQGDDALEVAHQVSHGILTVLSKTSETIALRQRWLIDLAELPRQQGDASSPQQQRFQSAQEDYVAALPGRSVAWVVGTSLCFELVVLSAAAFFFCRRDY